MGKSLVIVESPAKAKTINKYLGSNYIVKSSIGHVRDLSVSASQTVKTGVKKTIFDRMGIYPEENWKANYQILPGKEKVVDELRKYASQSDTIYLATDLDREGEAIAWHLQELIADDTNKQFRRVTFNEITKAAIQKAFEKTGDVDLQRVNAQQARRFLDRIVGFMISPLLWQKVARGLSAGRVQSVATKLIVEREKEIQKFIPVEYWRVFAKLTAARGIVDFEVSRYQGKKFVASTAQQTQEFEQALAQLDLSLTERTVKPVVGKPSPPFITSTLQQAASTKLGFTVKKTMMAAQKLYEAGYITYMRTDSTNISTDAIEMTRGYIGEKLSPEYLPEAPRYYSSKDGAQEAHEAIRPTQASMLASAVGDKDGSRLYDLIHKRFIACQMADARYENTSLKVEAGGFTLEAKGRVLLFDGYTKVLDNSNSKDLVELPLMQQGEALSTDKIHSSQHFTKPLPRFSEATLVRELEKRSIGRPSTYAPTISTIQDRGYVSLRNKRFHAEKIGEIVTDRLDHSFSNLMDYSFTADLEKNLDSVASGDRNWKELLDSFYKDLTEKIDKAKSSEDGMKPNDPVMTDIACPQCNRLMQVRYGGSGVFLGCSGYSLKKDEKCSKTMNLIACDELPSSGEDEDDFQLKLLQNNKRCSICSSSMDPYLVSNNLKLHLCGNSPECPGMELESGQFVVPSDDSVSEYKCDKCESEFLLKSGRFGKYFACSNEECGETRKMLANGKPSPAKMKPVPMPELSCLKVEDSYVLRDGASGMFLAASQFPKHRETRQVLVSELLPHRDEIDSKYHFLVDGPQQDPEGNPTLVRFSRKQKCQYIGSAKEDGKLTKWGVFYKNDIWVAE